MEQAFFFDYWMKNNMYTQYVEWLNKDTTSDNLQVGSLKF